MGQPLSYRDLSYTYFYKTADTPNPIRHADISFGRQQPFRRASAAPRPPVQPRLGRPARGPGGRVLDVARPGLATEQRRAEIGGVGQCLPRIRRQPSRQPCAIGRQQWECLTYSGN